MSRYPSRLLRRPLAAALLMWGLKPLFDRFVLHGLGEAVFGGAPGVYSARYAGEGHNDADNNRKLMEDMKNVPDELRSCRFASAVALARRGRETLCVIGYAEGRLLHEARGENGFGYDPYFFYPPLEKSFAELSADEKNAVSHRSRSLALLEEALQNEKQ